MNRRDRAIVAVLVLVLVALGGVLAIPRTPPVPVTPSSEPSPGSSEVPAVAYREGVVGAPVSITPVTARSRSERLLVGLVYSGLVRLGPGTAYAPDLAASWSVNPKGTVWTFNLRPDAVWQDGEPVTSDDVVFTVDVLKSPDAAGAVLAGQWADVTVTAPDEHTAVFTLGTPVAGFLAAATQPLLPAHLLADVPFADLATSDFARWPVGSGPYAITEIDAQRAILVPTASVLPQVEPSAGPASPEPSGGASPSPSDGATSSGSETPPASVAPSAAPADGSVGRIELHFYTDEDALKSAMSAGEIDAAAGLSKATTAALTQVAGTDRTRYPTTLLTAVLLNLRTSHPELRSASVRRALLAAIDRDGMVTDLLDGDAVRADAMVPPTSWAYDAASAGDVPFDRKAALKLLTDAGWTRKNGKLYAPKAKQPYSLQVLTVSAEANPKVAAVAAYVRDAWTRLGLTVGLVEAPIAELGPRLREGDFTASVIDIAEGLEPDLYSLLASSQVVSSGSNLAGFQDPGLDTLLEDARKPGTLETRQAAWKALLAGLAERQPMLPLVWSDEVMVSKGVEGMTPRLISRPGDRYWDVLAWRLAARR
ncbi:MAG: peptide ABC transporter substrate-binding protein [Chloroflexota bacterium]